MTLRLAPRCLCRSQAWCGGARGLHVKPSAQPTLVRTQHLRPHITPVQAVSGQIIAAGCWGCEPIWAGANASSGGVVSSQVRALRPDPAGTCGPGPCSARLSGGSARAVLRRSPAGREVVAALALRFPRIRARHMDTRGSGFQHRSLKSAYRSSRRSMRCAGRLLDLAGTDLHADQPVRRALVRVGDSCSAGIRPGSRDRRC
jgi:hypothetical protein